jgi:hypothetical protein
MCAVVSDVFFKSICEKLVVWLVGDGDVGVVVTFI